jgi:hypothetical protein
LSHCRVTNYPRQREIKQDIRSLASPTLNEQAVLVFMPGLPEKRKLFVPVGFM